MRALGKASAAVPRSRSLLARVDPAAVMGGGGYVAGPVGLAALTLRKPLVLTEADSRLGLTNRLLAPFARRVCLAFPIEGRDGRRYRVTGRPVSSARLDAGAARARMGVAAGERAVLVFGGSLGARSINLAAIEAFAEAPFHVIHVSGRRDHAELASRPRSSRYDLREYLPIEDFAAALAASDLVVARAGGSVFEIAAQARPAILIPYPRSAGGHQLDNARWMERAGAARVIDDRELTAGRLASAVSSLLADDRRLREMGEASAALARPQAARDIAAELLAAAR
jgi:UDP-N-acetylglucosamine--N-acetylmuramyl-(pentapeptide) pyrophosphoryl-undecaprenol N-acetylglucosamine transferase